MQRDGWNDQMQPWPAQLSESIDGAAMHVRCDGTSLSQDDEAEGARVGGCQEEVGLPVATNQLHRQNPTFRRHAADHIQPTISQPSARDDHWCPLLHVFH